MLKFEELLFDKSLDIVSLTGVVGFFAILPLAKVLPMQWGWENGILENAQVGVLAIGLCMNFYFYKKSVARNEKMQYLSIASFFALLIGRELSWGRVFFQTNMTKAGPTFIAMDQIPYHMLIRLGILLFIVGVLLALVYNVRWEKVVQVAVPVIYIVLIICNIIFSVLGEKGVLLNEVQGQIIEELAELMAYFFMVKIVYYYHAHLEKLEN
ncbi:hypothetical protein [Anaerosinus massiliensis]|uniref:hypothetical protein n=1 Tax=Massilibacillus massiliensis TaxID=1806837 RepID=UPI000DA5EEDA|nr:hypothetical protein [Massilibacillus massiliensis]